MSLASFAYDVRCFLVLAQANELRVPQVVVCGPLKELELPDEHGCVLHPSAA